MYYPYQPQPKRPSVPKPPNIVISPKFYSCNVTSLMPVKPSKTTLLNTTDYSNKLVAILHDTYKITKISRNHINSLKIEVDKLIKCINKQNPIKIPIIGIGSIPINPIIREFSPRYIYYGTFKIHKKKHLEPSYHKYQPYGKTTKQPYNSFYTS